MIRLFNHNHPSVYLALLLFSALCFIVIPFYSGSWEYTFTGPNNVAIRNLLDFKWLVFIVVAIVGFFNSVILNSLFVERENSPRSSHLPAAIYLIISAIASAPAYMLQNQLLMLFFLTAIYFLQRLEVATNEVSDSFFIGFFLALASVFSPYVLLLIFWILWRSASTRYSVVRVLFLVLVGFIIPLYLTWTVNFLFNNGQTFINAYTSLFQFKLADFEVSFIDKASFIFFGIMALISIIATFSSESYKAVQPRVWLQLWMSLGLIFTTIAIVFSTQRSAFQIAATPMPGLLCFVILGKNRKVLRQLIFYLWLVVMLIDHANTLGLIDLQKSIF